MSRTANFLKGITSGYLMMAVNILYTMGSIPMALHYLSKEEFGLWALVSQIAGYFSLLDMGMTSSVSRCLIDFKDDKTDKAYGSLVTTATVVFVIQGLLVALSGLLVGPFASHMVDIPGKFVGIFTILLVFQCLQLGLQFCTKIFGAILYSHQQYIVYNIAAMSQLLLMFFGLWFGFHQGMGLYSMLLASVLGFFIGTVISIGACVWLRLLPRAGCWGRPKMKMFLEMFTYGKDIFLIALGAQLISASQVIIITRLMGLEAAATWSVCTKAFVMAGQIVNRIYDFAMGAFSEMYVRGERERLCSRFRDSVTLTAFWTHGRISWDPVNNVLMGLMLFVFSITRCHGAMLGIEKKIGMGRFIPLAEGSVFILACLVAVPLWGFPGVLVSAISSDVLLQGMYGLYRSRCFFGCSYSEMTLGWLKAPMKLSLGLGAFALPVVYLLSPLNYTIQLGVLAGLFTLVAPLMLWFLGLTEELRTEMLRIISKIAPFLSVRKV